MAGRAAFGEEDIRALVRGPTDDARAEVAHRLCRRIDHSLTPQERESAHEVLRLMAADAAAVVRRALAVTLRASNALPHDVAMKLAGDIDSIALPILNFSPVFTDEDLAEIVRAGVEARQTAVAARPALGEMVTHALATHGCGEAVKTALANDRARFTEHAMIATLERFKGDRDVAAGMAYRQALPLSIAERLVNLVSDEVRRHLVDRHQISAQTAIRVAVGARERATVDLVDQAGKAADLPAFCAHLHRQDRLTASLLLRALVCGQMTFFETALAELAALPHHRAWLLVHDAGPLGLKAICDKAGMPPRLLPAFRAGVDTHHALLSEDGDMGRFQEAMLERFLTAHTGAPQEDVDHLLERLDRLPRPDAMELRQAA